MNRRDRVDGFRRLGSAPPEGLRISETRLRRLQLEAAWVRAVGAAVAAKVRCEGVRNGVLHLRAPDPSWAAAVERLLPRILARMGEGSGTAAVRRVRVTRGPVRGEADDSSEVLPPR